VFQSAAGTLREAPSAGFEIVPDAAFDAGLVGLGGALLILRAFSAGAAALTGIEAPAANVPSFEAPRARNAATTLVVLAAVASLMMAGVIYLANAAKVRVVLDPANQLLIEAGALKAAEEVAVIGPAKSDTSGAVRVWPNVQL